MSRTGVRGTQIIDGSIQSIDIEDDGIWREDLNTTSTGKAVITRILPGDDIRIDYTGADEGTGEVTIHFNSSTGGITASTHRLLDQLVHEIAEDSYCEIERTAGRVSAIYYYENATKTTLIRSIEYTRTAGRISQIVIRQYDFENNVVETLTGIITRSEGHINSIEWILT